jgi:hypothetical protein
LPRPEQAAGLVPARRRRTCDIVVVGACGFAALEGDDPGVSPPVDLGIFVMHGEPKAGEGMVRSLPTPWLSWGGGRRVSVADLLDCCTPREVTPRGGMRRGSAPLAARSDGDRPSARRRPDRSSYRPALTHRARAAMRACDEAARRRTHRARGGSVAEVENRGTLGRRCGVRRSRRGRFVAGTAADSAVPRDVAGDVARDRNSRGEPRRACAAHRAGRSRLRARSGPVGGSYGPAWAAPRKQAGAARRSRTVRGELWYVPELRDRVRRCAPHPKQGIPCPYGSRRGHVRGRYTTIPHSRPGGTTRERATRDRFASTARCHPAALGGESPWPGRPRHRLPKAHVPARPSPPVAGSGRIWAYCQGGIA